jgi:hypothetical protein
VIAQPSIASHEHVLVPPVHASSQPSVHALCLQLAVRSHRERHRLPLQARLQSFAPSHAISQPPPSQVRLHVEFASQRKRHLPPGQSKLHVVAPRHVKMQPSPLQVSLQLAGATQVHALPREHGATSSPHAKAIKATAKTKKIFLTTPPSFFLGVSRGS